MSHIDELAKEERLAYYKAWRAANPDKVKRQNKNYWRKRAERKLNEQQSSEKQEMRESAHENQQ